MKLKNRLLISFFIITIVPVVLFNALMLGLKEVIRKASEEQLGRNIVMQALKHYMDDGGLFDELVFNFCVAEFVILLLTAIVMVVWIYKGIAPQIKILKIAANNVKEGNLDFSVATGGTDEMSEVCNAFEDMRVRLKNNAKDRLEDEAEQRALISNIAHDLKTPITAIKGYAEGMLDGVADTPEKREKYIRTIYNKANEMNTLINELTLYSNIDTNKIPYNFQKLNIHSYFEDCIEELGMDLENQHIRLDYANYVDPDVLIIADPEQLGRIIHNIVSNSVKYMRADVASRIAITIKDVGDFVQIEIADNGKGIATKDLPYVFDRFYRADASRNSAAGGSGIGLSIVKKIVEDHGGKIWVTSKENEGTTMYFVIRKYQEVMYE
ncbi:HAMP domain-containing protein [Pseudobutyrivibrio sp. NOR37]|uniref:histidine kinase n=1 Tax=Pseudobutyrivibrio xylanivorans TaxID=185007 RepID=A0A6M0LIN1_PSEXY|nr:MULTISPECIES: HAMP domain-containing sensor histidine kinase [Pseudobutyrivibrio]NEX01819.1 HAMP domain-containing histidine kinase [Pseudobutyrivibrio xylanivorans]SFR71974.1 HAMP domain-containing protein [Pseudobutyrivibrio sp. NOR37]